MPPAPSWLAWEWADWPEVGVWERGEGGRSIREFISRPLKGKKRERKAR